MTSVQNAPLPAHEFNGVHNGYSSKFPDGLKPSGQHPPIYEMLQPFSSFPREITGPTVWRREDYVSHEAKWIHHFSLAEIQELSNAADVFLETGAPLTSISQSKFKLSGLLKLLSNLRDDLLNGKGFCLFKGFLVADWGLHKSAVACMALGTYLGYSVSQNGRGHILGHVKDLGEDSTQIDKVRICRTNARQFFHADDSDIVGLLCCARAVEGGESDIVSSDLVWNTIVKEHPDVAEDQCQEQSLLQSEEDTSATHWQAGQQKCVEVSHRPPMVIQRNRTSTLPHQKGPPAFGLGPKHACELSLRVGPHTFYLPLIHFRKSSICSDANM